MSIEENELTRRRETAAAIARDAGALALDYFRDRDRLSIEVKGHQDFVSEADREVETVVRRALAEAFPDDGIVGEEHAPVEGRSGFVWVIDPIDGTTNFINGIPAWTVVLACVADKKTQVGVIHDPCHDETWLAHRGGGATLNGGALLTPRRDSLSEGTTAIGYSGRTGSDGVMRFAQSLLDEGGYFARNGSGALCLAYVATGRFLGYVEEHMNAWDCIAGQLIIAEAGGSVEDQDTDRLIAEGGRVIAGAPGVFPPLLAMAEKAFR